MFAWLCRCRRRDLDIELDVPSPIPTSPTLPIATAGTVLAEPSSEPPTLVSRRRNPRRTRVFVRMPSGEILPADVDLNWTIAQASDYIIANCSNEWLEGLGGTGDGYSLRFKRKILRKQTTLKENGAEIGSVLGFVPSDDEPSQEMSSPYSKNELSEQELQ
ncbi:epsE [Symbiodinium necroappetens]|uniref:EpsE protein n=1 Tax=Symbiodinium necroappetens TaxID=1628268 RepID=A0A812MA12_9DINO|nr:epsE [Symbiodinium necroappetens]